MQMLSVYEINTIEIDFNLLTILSKENALKLNVLPLYRDEKKIYVLSENTDIEILQYLNFLYELEVKIINPKNFSITPYIHLNYNRMISDKFVVNYNNEDEFVMEKNDVLLEDNPVISFIDFLIYNAIMKNASDIHIEPEENEVIFRYRVDGVLIKIDTIKIQDYSSILTRLKVMANIDISQKRIPQDGKFSFKHSDESYDIRISTLPTIHGEKVVLRLLRNNNLYANIKELGFRNNYKKIEELINHKHGLILVTGPTGSGKTTTLYAMLNMLNQNDKNITSIEDPVEYCMKGITQTNVDTKSNLTFAIGLRAILRQDPDVILVGEIRDEETASIAVKAASTGHLVLSTLHTNDALSTITRLNDMGVPKYLLLDALIGIISQRLVKKICMSCSEEINYEERLKYKEFISEDITVKHGVGCAECNFTGYKGRVCVSEILYLDKDIKRKLKDDNNYIYIENSIVEASKELLQQGIINIEDYISIYSNWR